MKTKKEIIDFIENEYSFRVRYDSYLSRCISNENDDKKYLALVFKGVRNNIKKEMLTDIMNFISVKEDNVNEIN